MATTNIGAIVADLEIHTIRIAEGRALHKNVLPFTHTTIGVTGKPDSVVFTIVGMRLYLNKIDSSSAKLFSEHHCSW